jgi:hypothetical protein
MSGFPVCTLLMNYSIIFRVQNELKLTCKHLLYQHLSGILTRTPTEKRKEEGWGEIGRERGVEREGGSSSFALGKKTKKSAPMGV